MTEKNKLILIGIGSILFGFFYSISQGFFYNMSRNEFNLNSVILYSLTPIIMSFLLIFIYITLVTIFEKNYKIEFLKTFYTFWIGSIILCVIGTLGTLIN